MSVVPGVRAVIDQAWSAYRLRAPLLLALLAGWALTWVALEVLVIGWRRPPGHPLWVLLHLGYFWATARWEAAIAGCTLDHVAGRAPAFRRYLGNHRLALDFLLLKLVLIPVALLGTALFVIPGLLLTARLGLAFLTLVDRPDGPRAALARSWERTRGHTFALARLVLALAAFNVAGAALVGLGLLVTVPMTALAAAYVFHALSQSPAEAQLHHDASVRPPSSAAEPMAP